MRLRPRTIIPLLGEVHKVLFLPAAVKKMFNLKTNNFKCISMIVDDVLRNEMYTPSENLIFTSLWKS